MAVSIGTATNINDLFNKLRNFLVADATLVSAGENWTQISGNTGTLIDTDEVVLQGPGTAGTDEILVGIRTSISVPGDYYNLRFAGFTAWNPSNPFASQVNAVYDYTINCWNQPMPYWFIANGRRFMGVVRVESVYMSFYCGFVLPYVLPNLWPYPLFIGASSRQPTWRYSVVHTNMSTFFDPGETTAGMMFPDVLWYGVVNRAFVGSTEIQRSDRNVNPWRWDTTPVRENIDGSYNLEPAVVVANVPYQAQMGALQGVYRVSGFANSAESIITQGGVDHLVIPNIYRLGWQDYAAFALE